MRSLLTILSLLVATVSCQPWIAAAERPNIVFLFADDLGAGGHRLFRRCHVEMGTLAASVIFVEFHRGGVGIPLSR